jgi:hypothetical protein
VLGSQSFYSLSIRLALFSSSAVYINVAQEVPGFTARTLFLAAVFSSPASAVLGALVGGSLASGRRIGRQYYSCIGQPHCAPAWSRHVC